MLLGFLSLLLAVTQNRISKICIPVDAANVMLPCRSTKQKETEHYLAKEVVRSLSQMRINLLLQPHRWLEDDDDGTGATNNGTAVGAVPGNSCSSEVCF